MKSAIKEINTRLRKLNIDIEINQYIFNLFNKVYGIKENEKYCYIHKLYNQPNYSYSMQVIELIVEEIKKAPTHIIEYLKKAKK